MSIGIPLSSMISLRVNTTILAVFLHGVHLWHLLTLYQNRGSYTIVLLVVNILLFAYMPAMQLYNHHLCKGRAAAFKDSEMATLGLKSIIWANISCSTILVPVFFVNSTAHIIIAEFYLPMSGVAVLLASLMVLAAFASARAGAWPYLVLISALDERDATGERYREFWKGNERYLKFVGFTVRKDQVDTERLHSLSACNK
ncbi:hypothetical protein AB1N83_005333 [Pleurotus pulmonarius]